MSERPGHQDQRGREPLRSRRAASARRSFPADRASISAARRFALETVRGLADDLRDAVSVMVSELAMNAVMYAQTDFEVRMELTGGTLRVEVCDSGAGRPRRQDSPPASRPHGRGLLIVSELSDEWGISPAPRGPGKTVWFELSV